jgi:general secretion pathway protein M
MARRIAFAANAARLSGWWAGRSLRERRLLAVLGALVALAAIAKLAVEPLQSARATALADIRTYETLTARLRAAGPALGQQPAVVRRSGDPATIINASAAEFGVTVLRQEATDGAIRLTLSDVPFDAIVRWLADLERSSDLRLVDIRMERRPSPGLVAAELSLSR